MLLVIRTGLMRDVAPTSTEAFEALPQEEWKTHDQGCAVLLVGVFDPSLPGMGTRSDSDTSYILRQPD